MAALIQLSGSLRTQSRLTQWALLTLFVALSMISFFQVKLLLNSSATQAVLPGTLIKSMDVRLAGISEGITSYLQNHDPKSLERIQADGKDVSRLLAQYKDARIDKAHGQIREATLSLLAVDRTMVGHRQKLNETKQALEALLGEIESSIKPNLSNSEARHRAIRSATSEIKLAFNSADAESDPAENRSRFRRAMATYEELSRSRRATRSTEYGNQLFEQALAERRAYQVSKIKRQAALERFTQKRATLKRLFQEKRTTIIFGIRMGSVKGLFASGLAYMLFNGLLLVVGIYLVIGNHRRSEKQLIGPIHDILQCVEAAASGDVSRTPDYWARDEVGQLSQAVGRLIAVLSRSENLVYHLAALVESSGEAIISHSLEGTILSWNKGAQRVYGYSAEEVKGRSIALLSPQDGGAELMGNLEKIRRGERIQPFETVHQARNGRQVRALVRVSAIHDSTRKAIGASFCAQELTDAERTQPQAIENNLNV